MPRWTNMTLQQLRAASKADIVKDVGKYIHAHFTKLQICKWLLDVELIQDVVEVTRDEAGRIISRLQVWRHVVTGDVDHNSETTYTYYLNGNVEDITITKRDGDGNVTEQFTIHHYQDGRQPIRIGG